MDILALFIQYRSLEKIAAGYWRGYASIIRKETIAAQRALAKAQAADAEADAVGDQIEALLAAL